MARGINGRVAPKPWEPWSDQPTAFDSPSVGALSGDEPEDHVSAASLILDLHGALEVAVVAGEQHVLGGLRLEHPQGPEGAFRAEDGRVLGQIQP